MKEIIKDTIENPIEGGTITFSDGSSRTIVPHSCRYHLEIHGMAVYEFFYYAEGYHVDNISDEDIDPSDCIQVLLTSFDQEEPNGWLMNVQDALILIKGLSEGCSRAIEDNKPMTPTENTNG